jgi:TRAP-type C4-dicarboxylate transport system permease large subunit
VGEIFREVPPFILAMLAVVLAVTFFPQLALWLPTYAGLLKP